MLVSLKEFNLFLKKIFSKLFKNKNNLIFMNKKIYFLKEYESRKQNFSTVIIFNFSKDFSINNHQTNETK